MKDCQTQSTTQKMTKEHWFLFFQIVLAAVFSILLTTTRFMNGFNGHLDHKPDPYIFIQNHGIFRYLAFSFWTWSDVGLSNYTRADNYSFVCFAILFGVWIYIFVKSFQGVVKNKNINDYMLAMILYQTAFIVFSFLALPQILEYSSR